MQQEAQEQDAAAIKIQAIKKGNEARADLALKKSKVWAAVEAGDATALRAAITAGEDAGLVDETKGTPLRVALESAKWPCAEVLVGVDAALGIPSATELAVWAKVQADRKLTEGPDGEEPPDVASEEYAAALVEQMFADGPKEGAHTVKRILTLGLYAGGRASRDETVELSFDGELQKRDGFAVSLAPGGDVFVGTYVAGMRDGVGALRTASGACYAGEWKEGKRHGKGRALGADGAVYEGDWKYGKRHGRGTYTHKCGDAYTGAWFAGQKNGAGRYYQAAMGVTYEGEWRNGELVAAGAETEDGSAFFGTYDQGRPSGKGAFISSSGAAVFGEYTAPPPAEDAEEGAPLVPATWAGATFGEMDHSTKLMMKKRFCTVAPRINLCLSGPPASGKGTVAENIVKEFGLVHISTGDMLRAAMADSDNEAGQKAAEFMKAGELVPDELIVALVVARLAQPDCLTHGWMLDGFPRTAAQAAEMEKNFLEPTKVVILECPDSVILKRVTGRRSDPETGKIYHLEFSPPDGDDKEEVMARLTQRDDDTEEALTKRLAAFAKNKDSVIEAYPSALIVDANRDKGLIWEEVKYFLNK